LAASGELSKSAGMRGAGFDARSPAVIANTAGLALAAPERYPNLDRCPSSPR